MKPLFRCLLLCCILFVPFQAPYAEAVETPIVVIKADDLRYKDDGTIFGEGWNRFLEIAQAKGIKVSVGIICESLNDGAPAYFEKIRALHTRGQVEFWNHGYTHERDHVAKESEFKGPSFETQVDTLSRSQALAVEKLGFAFTSFGAPYNAKDQNTARAFRQFPELTNWMIGPKNAKLLPGQVVLHRYVNMEKPVLQPNFKVFKRDFLNNLNRPYYLLQGHPGSWNEAGFVEFSKILDFLLEQNAVFLTPTELASSL